ncbi:MAG: TolC family protein [Armatimonadetes bacterium]|nr:TolC family protein [Armatimonadota bacterium]
MKAILPVIATLVSASAFASEPVNLSQLSATALKEHPRVKAMVAERDAIDARRKMALVPFQPRLSLNGYGATGNGSMIFPSSVEPLNYSLLPSDSVAVANATFMWRVLSFGREAAVAEAGKADLRSADFLVRSEEQEVLLGLRMSFADAVFQRDRSTAFEAALASAQEVERVTQARFEAGKVPEAFTLRAKADTARAEKEVAMARADARAVLATLWESAGLEQAPDNGLGAWDVALDAPSTQVEAVRQALAQRPEYLALVEDRKAAIARTNAIARSRLPDLNFMAMDDQMAHGRARGENGFKAGLVLSFPIGDGGERSAAGQEARAMTKKLDADTKAMRNRITAEVGVAWAQWSATADVRKAAGAELAASAAAYEVALLRYQDGKSILAELTDARSQLTMAQLSVAEAAAYERKSWSKLARSVGGPTGLDRN